MNKLVLGYIKGDNGIGANELCENDFTWVPFKTWVRNGIQEFNSDAIFLHGQETLSDNSDYPYLLNTGIPIIGITRLSKLEQHLLFSQLGILCPQYYYIWNDMKMNVVSLLEEVEDEKFLIIKSMYGARGLEQFLVKKKDFVQKYPYETLESKSHKKEETIKKDSVPSIIKEPEALPGGDPEDEDYSLSFFKNSPSQFLITEKVNLKREFRILFFAPGNYLICERHLHANHFQNNLSVGAEVSYYRQDWSKLEKYQEQIQDYARRLWKELPTLPYFSLDVFITENDEVGLLEFSQEFGFKALDFNDVRKYSKEAIQYVYNQSKVVF